MQKYDYRVFISYRGESEGKEFGSRLYHYLTDNPMCEEKYGKVYFSPSTKDVDVNFKNEIPQIMENVKYFIMPLTQNFFANVWNEEQKCPNADSIIFLEIDAAIKRNCRFVGVSFPGFELDQDLIRKILGEKADELICIEPIKYEPIKEEEIFQIICQRLCKMVEKPRGTADLLEGLKPNVFLSFKRETEDKIKYPFYEKLNDVKRITLLNFASSSFITGIDIASTYEKTNELKEWFNYNLINGSIEANIILTNPHSFAAYDAASYKMYPSGLQMDKREIILHNMNKLFAFIRNNPKIKLNVFLTDIALPYGVMISEHNNPLNNHIKVDLYAPVINDDGMRPSFYLLQGTPETEMIYAFFEDNVKNIINNYSFRYLGHPDVKWITDKKIIHRGIIKPSVSAHTREAYDACIAAGMPIEVDLLLLSDGTIVVGRYEEKIVCKGEEKKLGECTKKDLRKYNEDAENKRVLTLDAFLEYVGNKIPILFEIKNNNSVRGVSMTDAEKKEYVKKVLSIVHNSILFTSVRRNSKNEINTPKIAFHSADPYVIKIIKEIDCMMPCGIISMDFTRLKNEISKEYFEIHSNNTFFEICNPDFVSYNVLDLVNSTIKNLCVKHGIPLLAWVIRDEETQLQAEDYECDGMIIEGSKSYSE